MRRILRQRDVVADAWRYPGETESAAPDAPRVLRLAELEAASRADRGPIGVWLEPEEAIERLAPLIDRLALIVVHFPKYGEGRGFSQGVLLRRRHGYRGELRAAGPLRRDQLYFLARCGFDAFDLAPAEDLEAARTGFGTFSVAYQSGTVGIVAPRQRAVAG